MFLRSSPQVVKFAFPPMNSFCRLVCTLQCYRGLTEGWEKILGLYSSVRDKGKEVLAQVDFLQIKYFFQRKYSIASSLEAIHQENEEVMLESEFRINSALKSFIAHACFPKLKQSPKQGIISLAKTDEYVTILVIYEGTQDDPTEF